MNTTYVLMWVGIVFALTMIGFVIIPNKKKVSVSDIYFEDEFEAEADQMVKGKEMTWTEKQKQFLRQSKTGITFEKYIILHLIFMGVVFAILMFVSQNPIISGLLSFIGLAFPKQYVKNRREAMIISFDKKLVDVLDRLISYLRNSPLITSFENIANATDVDPFIRSEFLEMLVDLKSGKSIEDAVYESYKRVGSEALKLMYVQIKLDRDLGLALPDLFGSVRSSIITKIHQKEDSRIITAQAVMQSNAITWVVVVILGLMYMFSPNVYGVFFESTGMRLVFSSCVGSISLGLFIIRKIVQN